MTDSKKAYRPELVSIVIAWLKFHYSKYTGDAFTSGVIYWIRLAHTYDQPCGLLEPYLCPFIFYALPNYWWRDCALDARCPAHGHRRRAADWKSDKLVNLWMSAALIASDIIVSPILEWLSTPFKNCQPVGCLRRC